MKIINIILTVVSALLSLYLGFKAFPNSTMEKLYINWIYYILIANVILWLFAFVRTRIKDFFEDVTDYWKTHKLALIIAFILVTLGTIISKPDFRILADETNLLSMSQALYENRECKNYTSVLYYYYGFKNVISSELDKRPALFPFTVSLFHSFFGYRPENIFVVNVIAAFLSLLLIYHLVRYKFGKTWGISSMLLLASYPLFTLYYTSGGFEVFNLLFSLIMFWLLIKFLNNPTAVNTEALLLFLPLVSQTRYESAVAIICVLPAIFIMLPKTEYYKFSYKLVLMPLFYVPVIWLRLLTDNLKGLQAVDKGKAFSFEFFKENINKAFSFFFGQDIAYGIVPIVTFIAIAGFVWAVIDFFINVFGKKQNSIEENSKKQEEVKICCFPDNKKAHIVFWSVALIFYIFHAVIRFAYWGGELTLRSQSRLAIIFLPIFIYYTIRFLNSICDKFKVRNTYCLIGIIALLFVYFPVAGQNLGVRDLTLYREFRAMREYLAQSFPNKNEFILVADRANMYVPLKYNSITFDYFRNNTNTINNNLKNRTYRFVLIAQIIDKKTNKAVEKCSVPESLRLENLYETQISADKYIRISKCRMFL